ncbi:putative beta-lysine N-acetyltransferase [Pelovirga terrestris]|uniref:Putative beta-lysine N-acetyltransferase n=1 Tax=Pelovirga terrestris TaxID=2771352 RepID=A0A8J6QNC2_9BACT|nr:putative beta-lysine N-acetyltransferase [Pelovirga terrestris]MBD1400732.1 putative beta-lysine N-acetyltransferase [Pelovirga terrestris]
MAVDRIESFGSSMLQHGPENDRVYLMKLQQDDVPGVLEYIDELVARHDYSKVFAKIPATSKAPFLQAGYRVEAQVPGFYQGEIDGLFLANYPQPERQNDPDAAVVAQVLDAARAKTGSAVPVGLPDDGVHQCRLAQKDDCSAMADLYQRVFSSYPFPIHDPDYLAETMTDHVIYAGIWKEDELLALASAEVDTAGAHAEMTDFATDPACRGKGLAHLLLAELETLMAQEMIQTCYTIARATSFGMNITFAKSGYQYGGTLVQNTQISGGLESMNVWYKPVE